MKTNEIVKDLCNVYGCERAIEIIEESIDILGKLGNSNIANRIGVLEDIKKDPGCLQEYADELNEWLDGKVQEIVNDTIDEYDTEEEAKAAAWEQLEKDGLRPYTADNITFTDYLDGPRPYWEIKGEEISKGLLCDYDVDEEVKEFVETYCKELMDNRDEFLAEVKKLEDISKVEEFVEELQDEGKTEEADLLERLLDRVRTAEQELQKVLSKEELRETEELEDEAELSR